LTIDVSRGNGRASSSICTATTPAQIERSELNPSLSHIIKVVRRSTFETSKPIERSARPLQSD
jgi:hypothetical protein